MPLGNYFRWEMHLSLAVAIEAILSSKSRIFICQNGRWDPHSLKYVRACVRACVCALTFEVADFQFWSRESEVPFPAAKIFSCDVCEAFQMHRTQKISNKDPITLMEPIQENNCKSEHICSFEGFFHLLWIKINIFHHFFVPRSALLVAQQSLKNIEKSFFLCLFVELLVRQIYLLERFTEH